VWVLGGGGMFGFEAVWGGGCCLTRMTPPRTLARAPLVPVCCTVFRLLVAAPVGRGRGGGGGESTKAAHLVSPAAPVLAPSWGVAGAWGMGHGLLHVHVSRACAHAHTHNRLQPTKAAVSLVRAVLHGYDPQETLALPCGVPCLAACWLTS
jgi:hypothetical protein